MKVGWEPSYLYRNNKALVLFDEIVVLGISKQGCKSKHCFHKLNIRTMGLEVFEKKRETGLSGAVSALSRRSLRK